MVSSDEFYGFLREMTAVYLSMKSSEEIYTEYCSVCDRLDLLCGNLQGFVESVDDGNCIDAFLRVDDLRKSLPIIHEKEGRLMELVNMGNCPVNRAVAIEFSSQIRLNVESFGGAVSRLERVGVCDDYLSKEEFEKMSN
jgi:hypothetical protein